MKLLKSHVPKLYLHSEITDGQTVIHIVWIVKTLVSRDCIVHREFLKLKCVIRMTNANKQLLRLLLKTSGGFGLEIVVSPWLFKPKEWTGSNVGERKADNWPVLYILYIFMFVYFMFCIFYMFCQFPLLSLKHHPPKCAKWMTSKEREFSRPSQRQVTNFSQHLFQW